jgi:hypothetical protein
LLKDHIQPAVLKAGFLKIGWHSFRHTVSAWGKEAGFSLEEVKTLFQVMRHTLGTDLQQHGTMKDA